MSAREANYLDANNIIEDDVRDEALARAAATRDEISTSQSPFVGTVNEAVPDADSPPPPFSLAPDAVTQAPLSFDRDSALGGAAHLATPAGDTVRPAAVAATLPRPTDASVRHPPAAFTRLDTVVEDDAASFTSVASGGSEEPVLGLDDPSSLQPSGLLEDDDGAALLAMADGDLFAEKTVIPDVIYEICGLLDVREMAPGYSTWKKDVIGSAPKLFDAFADGVCRVHRQGGSPRGRPRHAERFVYHLATSGRSSVGGASRPAGTRVRHGVRASAPAGCGPDAPPVAIYAHERHGLRG